VSQLVWDRPGSRVFETGLDRGVLYLPDGSGVVWNGLTSVVESFATETAPVYFDGMKIQDGIVPGDFSAVMKAVTYPDEFLEIEGLAGPKRGMFYADQPPKTFGLSYRSLIGNDLEGAEVGYKLHVLYNLTATPNDKTYASQGGELSLMEFEWQITGVPEEILGYRPTCHLILDSRDYDPWLLEEIEDMLYGTLSLDAEQIPMQELIEYINTWYRVQIIDNGDGTWTANTDREGFISFVGPEGYFSMTGVNATYSDEDTYILSDTLDISDVPQIKIATFEDGVWSASTEHDNIITMTTPDTFEIANANVVWLNDELYIISDTVD
jgi:hypothetical protein